MPMNEDQLRAAHFTLKADCLVAAGAGAGKTGVLSTRAQYLCEHCRDEEGGRIKPTNLLVLTFTEKAASEMKSRIKEEIAASVDKEVASMAYEVDNASICTFDSFAYSIVREYASELSLSCSPQIGDEAYFDYLRQTLFDEIVERRSGLALTGKDEGFFRFASLYCRQGFSPLSDYVGALDRLASLYGDKEAFFKGYRERYFGQGSLKAIEGEFEYYCREYLRQAHSVCSNYEDADLARLDCEAIDGYLSEPIEKLIGAKLSLPRRSSSQGTESDHASRDWVKDKLLPKAAKFASFLAKEKLEQILPCLKEGEIPLQIASEINERLSKFKFENGIFNFDDIASLATKACHNPDIVAALKRKYRYIMVDEFQDTTNLQMNLLSELRDHNFFAVGDVKQSIYGFRNANPELFLSMLGKCDGNDCHLIRLSDNYRSRQAVLDNVNRLFLSCMSLSFGGVDYQSGEALRYGLESYGKDDDDAHGFAKITFIPKPGETELETAGKAIARDIAYAVAHKRQVYDKETKCFRDARYGDFAILAPKNQMLQDLVRVFNECGIPYVPSVDELAVDVMAFNDFRSLIKLADCLMKGDSSSYEFRLSLIGIERSFLFPDFSDDLILSNVKEDPACFESYRRMKEIADRAEGLSNKAVLESIKERFQILRFLYAMPKQRAVMQTFLKLEEFASTFDYLGKGFGEFAEFVARLDPSSLKLKVDSGVDAEGAVKGFTIHRSKGLEYPYVYLLGNEKDIERAPKSESFVCTLDHGLVLPFPGTGEKCGLDALGREKERQERRSEKLRLFYVGITRARERCTFLLRGESDPSEQKDEPTKPPFLCKTHADLLRQAPDIAYIHLHYEGETALPKLSKKEVEVEFKTMHDFALDAKPRPSYSDQDVHSNEQAIAYGERIHRLLELTDFKRRLIPDACDEAEKKRISAILANPLFDGIEREYHEYRFQGEHGEGCIDLFFIKSGRIYVVDFKSSDLENPLYAAQVKGYCDYLSAAFKLPCEGYLLSFHGNQLRKVA